MKIALRPRLNPAMIAALVLALALAPAAAGIVSASSSAGASPCAGGTANTSADADASLEIQPTARAELLSRGVWAVVSERAEVISDAAGSPGMREGPRAMIGLVRYDRDGWISQSYTYGRDGELQATAVYARAGSGGPNRSVVYYTASEEITAIESIDILRADDGAAIVRRTVRNADGSLREIQMIRHDESGREVSSTALSGEGVLTAYTAISRDALGRPTLIRVYDARGTLVSRTKREYDADTGELLSETNWSPEGVLVSTFESGSDLNWVVRRNYRVVFGADGAAVKIPIDVIYRRITAYG